MIRRRRWDAVGMGLLLALVGCSYDLAEQASADGAATNRCVTDSDCGDAGHCSGGRCVAGALDYDQLLVEIAVPANPSAGSYAGTRVFRSLAGLNPAGGPLDIEVPRFATVRFAITAPSCVDAEGAPVERVYGACPSDSSPPSGRTDCRYDFQQAPVEVVLTPAARALGISTERYSAVSVCRNDDCSAGEVAVEAPPGDYDVYVRADPATDTAPEGICAVVPDIASVSVPDRANLDVDYELREPSLLEVEVRWDTSSGPALSLSGWTLDMVDGASARRISSRALLDTPTTQAGIATYSATLEFLPTAANGGEATELVRLAPPEGAVAPTVVVERSSLSLFGGPAVLDQLTVLPGSVEVEGQLFATSADGTAQASPVGGTVTLIATALDGLPVGTLAAFQRTVTASSDAEDLGVFRATLLPGKYKVRVLPSGSCPEAAACAENAALCDCPLGATEVDGWIVAPSPALQAGKTVELGWRTRVTGRVLAATGEAVAGAPVQATAVPTSSTALATALGTERFVPRAATGAVSADGSFDFRVDSGEFDITVRPDAGSGFAWLVRPGVPIEANEANVDLGDLTLPLPVAFTGLVKVPADPLRDGVDYAVLPAAVLRAYLAVDEGTVVQVAEATADDSGAFELLLPEHLASN